MESTATKNGNQIKRGDRVVYVKEPGKVLVAVSNPEPFNGMLVVTCKYQPPNRRGKDSAQSKLVDVSALEKAECPQ